MASSDYYLCDICGTKLFYDAEVDWDSYKERIGKIIGICSNCAKDHEIIIKEKE